MTITDQWSAPVQSAATRDVKFEQEFAGGCPGTSLAILFLTDVVVDGLGQADDARLHITPPQLLVDRLTAPQRAVAADGVHLADTSARATGRFIRYDKLRH